MALKDRLNEYYHGDSARAHRFRYGLLIFDVTAIIFVVATSFSKHGAVIEAIDAVFGLVILADYAARLLISRKAWRFIIQPLNIVDLVVVISFLAPVTGEAFAFLRALRTLRLLRTYQLLNRLRQDFNFFRRNEDLIFAVVNLIVFLFIMTGTIYALQRGNNPEINNFVDALYFTVATLTTTGFGDITLSGTTGRLLSVVVMIFGTTLFIRLAQVLLRPPKVRQPCSHCGLVLHDADAVHCKHCGHTINIATEGQL
jgi:voltage-gated potassium channel